MIFPGHCRFIGVINKHVRKDYKPSDAIYFSSQYTLVFSSPEKCEVYEVTSSGEGLIKKKTDIRRIASSDETLVYRGLVDITNKADLIRKAVEACKDNINTVVFMGVDRHYMFIHEPSLEALTTIDVYDVAPPEPAWLAYNVKRLEETGMFGDLGLTFNFDVLDLKRYEDPKRTTIFPCHASGLKGLFLDSLDSAPAGDIKLVGCNTSKLVFDARYPLIRYEHINICPLSTRKPRRPFILRCCQSDKLGLKEIEGVPGIAVHWGASPLEISEAVRLLATTIKKT